MRARRVVLGLVVLAAGLSTAAASANEVRTCVRVNGTDTCTGTGSGTLVDQTVCVWVPPHAMVAVCTYGKAGSVGFTGVTGTGDGKAGNVVTFANGSPVAGAHYNTGGVSAGVSVGGACTVGSCN
ncbi:MAG: hypothetical protein WDA27_11425 [Actinomycetota bacterium]